MDTTPSAASGSEGAQAARGDARIRRDRLLCVVLLAAVWGYTVLRAQRLSLTHDEALTRLIHVAAPLWDIVRHTQNIESNNHLLNTLLIKALVGPFGDSELVLRIPALLGHALYLLAVYRILTAFQSGARLVLGAALLATSPLLVDFFSCARGYALGLGLSTLAVAYLFERCVHPARRTLATGVACVALLAGSVLANLAFANLFLAAGLAQVLVELAFRQAEHESFAQRLRVTTRSLVLPSIVAIGLLASIYTPAVLERIRSNLTTWGGTTGFWADTVGSLVTGTLYGKAYCGASTETVARTLVALACLGAIAIALARGRRHPLALPMAVLLLVLALAAASLELQFHALGTRYPLDRGVLYLIPAFLLLLVLSWEALRAARSRAGHALGAVVALLLVHGVLCANTTHNFVWQYDATTKDAVERVCAEIGVRRHTRTFRFGLNWAFEPTVLYYMVRNELHFIEPPDRSGPDGEFDYYYVREEDRAVLEKRKLQVLEVFPVSGGILARH